MTKSLEERFWSKVDKDGPTMDHMETNCWTWTGAGSNYGVFWLDGKNASAHRVSHWLATRESPEMVCHHCDNKKCVNPSHLYSGDSFSNGKDAADRFLTSKGESNSKAKLTEAAVRDIRRRREAGQTLVSIAAVHQITHPQVRNITLRKQWAHIE